MLDREDIERYNELREKDKNGTITPSEYDEIVAALSNGIYLNAD